MKCRVLKLGGSLLDLAGIPHRLQAWISSQPPARNVLIVGGGQLVNVLRQLDRTHSLGEATAHWLALDAMGITARLVAQLLDAPLAATRTDLDGASLGSLCVLDVRDILNADHPTIQPLPRCWSVTSDSIAAYVANVLVADELVLLKSAAPPHMASATDLAASGYVDPYFPRALGRLPFRAVNLRSELAANHTVAVAS